MRKIIAIAALALTATVAVPSGADAAVTNCSSSSGTLSFAGLCSGTTANPPYTTQFAILGTCKKGTKRMTVAGDWRNAGGATNSIAYCLSGWTTVPGTQYFLFR